MRGLRVVVSLRFLFDKRYVRENSHPICPSTPSNTARRPRSTSASFPHILFGLRLTLRCTRQVALHCAHLDLINVAPALRPYVQEPEKRGSGTVELDDPGVAESKGD